VWLASKAFQERSRQSRFADAWLAREQHHLPFANLTLRPAPEKQIKFFFAPNKLCQAACMHGLEAAFD
jgi:hypothetical protein